MNIGSESMTWRDGGRDRRAEEVLQDSVAPRGLPDPFLRPTLPRLSRNLKMYVAPRSLGAVSPSNG